MIELRALSVLAVGALLSGCAASIAGFGGGHVAGEPRSAIAGGRAYGLVTTSRAGGLALGVVHEEAWTLAKSPSFAPDRFQTALSFGYLDAPLPHRGRVGYEAHALGGVGRFESRGRKLPALTSGVRLGLPLRLGASREIWEDEAPLAATLMLVPELGATAWFPREGGGWGATRLALDAGIAFRFFFWSSLSP